MHETRPDPIKIEELEVTWRRATAIWWGFVWRSLVLGFGIGFVVALVAGMSGENPQSGKFNLLIYLLMIPGGIWIMKDLLTNRFKQYRIALVPLEEDDVANDKACAKLRGTTE